jgi:hypothetical protein
MGALVNSIVRYLQYARQQYGAEPDLFSFNEANIGIDVLLTAEEHRDMIKRLGAAFEQNGLKTRLLLGDATWPAQHARFRTCRGARSRGHEVCKGGWFPFLGRRNSGTVQGVGRSRRVAAATAVGHRTRSGRAGLPGRRVRLL